jgi:hypothetical protein
MKIEKRIIEEIREKKERGEQLTKHEERMLAYSPYGPAALSHRLRCASTLSQKSNQIERGAPGGAPRRLGRTFLWAREEPADRQNQTKRGDDGERQVERKVGREREEGEPQEG